MPNLSMYRLENVRRISKINCLYGEVKNEKFPKKFSGKKQNYK
jgi:hypothetical protein